MGSAILEFDSRLDSDFLKSIYEDDMEHAEMVFETFMKNIGMQMTELDQCFLSGDPEYFRKKIHKLKPVLSYVGLTALTSKAEMIEKSCAADSNIKDLAIQYNMFKNELNEMIPVVKSELDKFKS